MFKNLAEYRFPWFGIFRQLLACVQRFNITIVAVDLDYRRGSMGKRL
ncbi:hypothetical protein (doubtful CDS) [Clavibacter sepedonicus]|uniref:Uncharacterized protein n=1 Tax=Clavibacter sepedonicus TaxID=31964 RepID=B0RGG6_CLASE|nr:hypothetical protein (doubtful CDS) [Clavibacter sepedonicus]